MVNIYYRYRQLIITGLLIVIAIFLALIAMKVLMPGTENEDTIIATGTGYSKLDYQVALKDNDIYQEQMISDQEYYLSPFTKYIKFYATAGLDAAGADKATCINGGTIYLMAKIDQGGDMETIWAKEYPYIGEKVDTSDTGSLEVNREYSVFLDQFNNLINDLAENHGLYNVYELNVVFEGEFIVEKNGKTHSEPFKTIAVINLNDVVYQVDIMGNNTVDVVVKETREVSKGIDYYPVLVFIGMVLIFGSILAYVLLKTISVHEVDMYNDKVQRIMREYHSRLAELSKTLTYQASVMISIEKFEDLIKIADEIGQMVFYYEVNEADERKIEFYVFDDARIYYLVMFG